MFDIVSDIDIIQSIQEDYTIHKEVPHHLL